MKALEGMVVVDFTQAFSGPFCTMQLADFGATVIKIERPYMGDQSREWTPFKGDYSGYFASINRGKKGFAIDMGKEEGAEVLKKLIAKADVVMENFKVGTLDKFGLGYEDVKAINPGIIYASVSGFGQYGELCKLPAYDNVIQSVTGFQSITGYPDKTGVRCGSAIGDSFTGMNCCYGILMAYYRKLRTGEGARVDVSMYDTIFSILEPHILAKTVENVEHERMGNSDKYLFAPCDAYPCKDGLFTVGVTKDEDFVEFCKAIEKPGLAEDERFKDNASRCANYDALTEEIKGFFADKTRAELEEIFMKHGIINAPFLSIPEIMDHPQMAAREMVVEFDDPGLGKYRGLGNPMHLSKTPASYDAGAPLIGQDTVAIMKDLGYSDAEMEDLKEKEVIQF